MTRNWLRIVALVVFSVSLAVLPAFPQAARGRGPTNRASRAAPALEAELAGAASSTRGQVTIVDIGTLTGRPTAGFGINQAGDVAGTSYVTGTIGQIGGPPAEPFIGHAVLYSGGSLQDLGAIEGGSLCSPLGCDSHAFDINASRWVVGGNDGDYGLLAVAWLPQDIPGGSAGPNVLPRLASQFGAEAAAVNDAGIIVGRSSPDGIGPRAVRWEFATGGPVVSDLGTLRADGSGYAVANAINTEGEIVGAASDDTGYNKAFLFLPEPAYGLPAGMNDLMAGIDAYGHGAGVNVHGEVAGEIELGVPWIWLPSPAYGLPAGLSLLPMPAPIVAFFPDAISDAGQIVGQAYVQTNPRTRDYVIKPALWRNGHFTMLEDVLPPRSPWILYSASDVVHVGKTTRITGNGGIQGVVDSIGLTPASRGYVLSVTCTGDLDDDGDVDAVDLAAQRAHLGESVPPGTDGDLDGDGDVDASDVALLARQIGGPCL